MVITTAQFHSSTPDLRFKLCVMLEIHDVEDMFMVPAENKAKHLSTVNHTIKTIHHHQTSSVCYYHVAYAFQSESTLYICLHVKDLLARSMRKIWSLSDCNWTQTHNHLVHKRLWTMWLWVQVQLQSITKSNNNCLWGYYRRSCYFFFNL